MSSPASVTPVSYTHLDVYKRQPVLVSGDHAKVDAWRRKNAIERTCRWRPDLIETARLTPEERAYAQEILDASYSQSEE